MSEDRISGTLTQPATVLSSGESYFAGHAFIRLLHEKDKTAIVSLQQNSTEFDDSEEVNFGVFNSHCQLVGLYHDCDEAFKDAEASPFFLHWVQ
jgi:hypothetical protein